MASSALFHNESVPVHSWTKSVIMVIDHIFHHGDAIEMKYIFMHFQAIKYPMPIIYILRICQWWQILFMILNLRRERATAALHFSLRTTSVYISI